MTKKALILTTAVLLFWASRPAPGTAFSQEQDQAVIAQRIQNVEKGLLEFKPGPADPAAPPPKTLPLAELMALHKVPGVSIAVINNNEMEWTKGCGVLKAGEAAAVTPESEIHLLFALDEHTDRVGALELCYGTFIALGS